MSESKTVICNHVHLAELGRALFGVWNRWGKMTATMYASTFSSLVPMLDMSFTSGLGRTYR